MVSKNPAYQIKDAALGVAGKAAGPVVGPVRGAVAIGRTLVGAVGSRLPLASALRSLTGGDPASEPAAPSRPVRALAEDGSRKVHGDPVDPRTDDSATAPATKPAAKKPGATKPGATKPGAKKPPAKKAATSASARASRTTDEPVTSIDAAADPDAVEATPADVARVVSHGSAAHRD